MLLWLLGEQTNAEDQAGDAGLEGERKGIVKVKGPLVPCPSMDRLAFDRRGRKPELHAGTSGSKPGWWRRGELVV